MNQYPDMPTQLKPWLYASGSLTQQLMDIAQGQFHVDPLHEAYQKLTLQDARWLNMSHQHIAWVRESHLFGCDEQPWVKAKSIFPILSLQQRARIFKHIGRQPIGHFLFQRTHPQCQRRVFYLPEGWTRQSCYTWHHCRFIIQEAFLADFERFIQK
mgnify:CR=1 FL=1